MREREKERKINDSPPRKRANQGKNNDEQAALRKQTFFLVSSHFFFFSFFGYVGKKRWQMVDRGVGNIYITGKWIRR